MILTLFLQVVVMFILAACGFIMFKTGKITKAGSKTLGNILIYLSLPCVIINGFQVERTKEAMIGLLISAVAALVIIVLSVVISKLCFRKDAIAVFASSFSNPGFFGIPLIVASMADGAVFYIAAFIAFLNLFQWTYGVMIMTGGKVSLSFKRVITAPFIIAILIGMAFFFSGLRMPSLIAKCVSFLAGLNTPIAMFTIGIYLAQTDIKKMILNKKLYLITLVRLVAIPLLTLLLLWLVPGELMDMKLALLIASACPVGSNVAVYAELHNADYTYAVETVVISTLFSILTIPGMVQLATMLWQIPK